MKKPSSKTAWSSTCAASLMVITFGFSIAANASILHLVLVAFVVVTFTLSAVGEWKKYFERFVRNEIEHDSRCGGQVAARPESEES